MLHTILYTPPLPTLIAPTQVATSSGLLGGNIDLWFLNTQAAPVLDAVKVEEEAMVTSPGIGILNTSRPSALSATTLLTPRRLLGRTPMAVDRHPDIRLAARRGI